LSLPGSFRQYPLLGTGMTLRVILLRTTANFFRDPSSPWVRFFSYRWRNTARCQSPYRFFIVLTIFPGSLSLGTSSCTATDLISLDFPLSSLDRLPSILSRPSFLYGRPSCLPLFPSCERPSFPAWNLFCQ
jgi:hypothetical protein